MATEHGESRYQDGGAFIFNHGEPSEPIWGDGGQVLWCEGEPLMIAAPIGVGKTTLAQQLVLARLGIRPPELLRLSVDPLRQQDKVLYLAMDRPRQIARSFRRMVDQDDYGKLEKRLDVYVGPPILPIASKPECLVNWIDENFPKAVDVVADSLKDMVVGISNDDAGAALNNAIQLVVASGREWLSLHHPRKPQEKNRTPNEIGDIYGSTWLTAGHGSVVMLWGEAGGVTAELKHLKPVEELVGPLTIFNNHATGTTTVGDTDITATKALQKAGHEGMSLTELTRALHGAVTRATKQRTRRTMKLLEEQGSVRKLKSGSTGGAGGGANEPVWAWRLGVVGDG